MRTIASLRPSEETEHQREIEQFSLDHSAFKY